MELPKSEFYQFALQDDLPVITIHRDVLAYFGTLKNMVTDFADISQPQTNQIVSLPDFIDREVLQWIVDAYLIYHAYGAKHITTFDDLYDYYDYHHKLASLLPPEESVSMFNLFGRNGGRPLEKDLPLLLTVTLNLNWLDGQTLLVLLLDKVYSLVKGISSKALLSMLISKDDVTDSTNKNGLPLTPYYKRERLIYAYLTERLPLELLRARLRLQQYVNPLECGVDHQLFLAIDVLYGSGDNSRYQLGVKSSTFVDGLIKIASIDGAKPLLIACGGDHSLALTDQNVLYACGLDREGELGLGKRIRNGERIVWTALGISEGEVLLIETCHQHTMVLTTMGLYACGYNREGQLGLGDTQSRTLLTRITAGIEGDVLDVKCGTTHTILLTNKGLYGCGSNERGQLATPSFPKGYTRFERIGLDLYGDILSIACGTYHTAVVTTSGLFMCGTAHEGQLGLGGQESSSTKQTFRLVVIEDEEPVTVFCADSYTIVLTKSGRLYGTGRNTQGNLGNGEIQRNTLAFTLMQGVKGKIHALSCCYDRVFILTSEGVFQTGEQVWIPTEPPTDQIVMNFTHFTKLKLDLGYDLSDNDSEETLGLALRCDYCRGNASFATTNSTNKMFFCSRYCLYKSIVLSQ